MKIQGLAIIFIIIVVPITIVIGEYANVQIETLRLEQSYDSKLITATHDALSAFQINTFNDATSDIADSKISSIEASANAFYNALEAGFGLEGYSKEDLKMYVPALVYTMYDGYYIYSPYTNVADISGEDGLEIDLDSKEIDYGFKPYVYYSCRYVNGDIDVIINYSLDNYITVQGTIGENAVYKSGYLLTIASSPSREGVYYNESEDKCYYSGIEIQEESNLADYLLDKDSNGDVVSKEYKYIKLNGTKYYWNEDEEYIFYIMGGNRIKQVTKATNEGEYNKYINQIQSNSSAKSYYIEAYKFTTWVNANLSSLKPEHAQVGDNEQLKKTSTGAIFSNNQIEYSSSNFNLHRKEVIRYSIESNLSAAIANFNSYTNSTTDFQMPKLKETEWEMLENDISIISFLQGLNIGGKIYNGYTVVTNNKTEEVVKEESIYITVDESGDSKADYYHRINDKHLTEEFVAELADDDIMAGVLDLDFEIRKDGATGYSYIHRKELGCYTSIIGQTNVDNSYDSIYEYLQSLDSTDAVIKRVKQLYYTALGRERWGTYKLENPSSIITILNNMRPEDDNDEGTLDNEQENKEPEITIESTVSPEYISASQNAKINANITVNCETSMKKVEYIFTDSSIEPTEGWQTITISEGGTTAYAEVSYEVSTAGTWYLYVKAASGNLEITKTRSFIIQEEEEVTYEIQIIDTDGVSNQYSIPQDGSVTLEKQVLVTASNGDTENLTIQYCLQPRIQSNAPWSDEEKYTSDFTISKTIDYNSGGYYELRVRVLNANGDVVASKGGIYYLFVGEE